MNPKKEVKKFAVGDKVGWISKFGNRVEIKKGEVVAVVPPEKDFREVEKELSEKSFFLSYWSGGTWSKKESYAVITTEEGHLSRLYWPRVELLDKINEINNRETHGEKLKKSAA